MDGAAATTMSGDTAPPARPAVICDDILATITGGEAQKPQRSTHRKVPRLQPKTKKPVCYAWASLRRWLEYEDRKMNNHRFTLILSGVSEITPELADALYAATGGDIEFNMRDGVAFLEFDRASSSLRDAVTSAISQVEGAGVGARVVRVESQAANTIAKINADLLGLTTGT